MEREREMEMENVAEFFCSTHFRGVSVEAGLGDNLFRL